MYPPGVWSADLTLSFAGVTFVWLYFIYVIFASNKAAILLLIVPRYACAPTATPSYLANVCPLFLLLFGAVAFSEYLYHCRFLSCMESTSYLVRFFSGFFGVVVFFRVCLVSLPFSFLYGEYVVRCFLAVGVFLHCDHGLEFRNQLMFGFNQLDNQSTFPSSKGVVYFPVGRSVVSSNMVSYIGR